MAKNLNTDDFMDMINKEEGYVLVDFYASWCGPCKMMAPIVDEFSKKSKIPVYKVNIDEADEIAKNYNVMSIPTFMILKKGEIKDIRVGGMNPEMLEEFVESNIN